MHAFMYLNETLHVIFAILILLENFEISVRIIKIHIDVYYMRVKFLHNTQFETVFIFSVY